MQVVNLAQKFAAFQDYFNPKIVGELNNFQVKLVKVQGEFMWHHHDAEDEMFMVTKGELHMKWRDAEGREHDDPIRPAGTLNTGNVQNERTVADLQKI
jgi:mannose-6-phosphate isomerase-like protein (cupin superfamily)